ncbi:MAG TPA: hypothetical protein VIG33_06025 [Pseudobdellovibrionaceae bacterium]|jgi:hypothetical protein
MGSRLTIIYFLLASSISLAKPFPSSGDNINCSLSVYDITIFAPCSYGPSCQIDKAQASVVFETLEGALDKHLNGSVSVKEIRGFREANGGPISKETQILIKLIQDAELRLEIDYNNPLFSANLWSESDSQNFKLSLKKRSDMSRGNRNNGPISELVKLKSNDSTEGGVYGQLSCSPSRVK